MSAIEGIQGTGTESDPYLIFTVEQFYKANDNGHHLKIMRDFGENEKITFTNDTTFIDLNNHIVFAKPVKSTNSSGSYLFYNNNLANGKIISNYDSHYIDRDRYNIFARDCHGFNNLCIQILNCPKEIRTFAFRPNTYEPVLAKNTILDFKGTDLLTILYPDNFDSLSTLLFLTETNHITNGIEVKDRKSITWADLPDAFTPDKWEITLDGLMPIPHHDWYISGKVVTPNNDYSNLWITAHSPIGVDYSSHYTTDISEDGTFYLPCGGWSQPLVAFVVQKIQSKLVSRGNYALNECCLPGIQNGYYYVCTTAGTTEMLPDQLPTTGTLTSGTAEFAIKPLTPSAIYGPLTPAKKAAE